MADQLLFFYQLQHVDYNTLANRNFRLGVVDDDDAKLTPEQIQAFGRADKDLWAYASVGEAETFRGYWTDNNWSTNPPDFIIGQNENWATGYRVKFWDADWQKILTDRIAEMINKGYSGIYLDVVDVYTVPVVREAYFSDHPSGDVKKAMEDFIVTISESAKALNPEFHITIQNAVALLSNSEIVTWEDLSKPLDPNMRLLNAIDGIGKESTFALGDVYPISWGPWDARYVENATNNGKYVIGLEFPTTPQALDYSLTQMLKAGYIPYFDTRLHNGNYMTKNYEVAGLVDPARMNAITGTGLAAAFDDGTAGNDTLVGSTANNTFHGLAGNDVIYGLEGSDTLDGGTGNDRLLGWDGNDSIIGGAGHDSIYGDIGNDTLNGQSGDDNIYGWDGNDLVYGGAGNDIIFADAGADVVWGGDGNDIVYAGAENDYVNTGIGNDSIYGDTGNDTIFGNDGEDQIFGWTGADSLIGGLGNDIISGDDGNDTLRGDDGNDVIYAGTGNDHVIAGAGDDWILADAGDDAINAGSGNDVIYAFDGNDRLSGAEGNDFISGEAGNDVITGGTGTDELYGGTGADRFIQNSGDGFDMIRDFTVGVDKIQMLGFGVGASFATTILANITYADGRASIALNTIDSLHFDGIVAGSFTASDFIFG